uniref:Uncharacterized protein n=1 Tax=Timema monikensis TaxID=170555 RepID=A0A7R9HUX0_9NEOP|nr:unnamed protein product [Timema monikensis]
MCSQCTGSIAYLFPNCVALPVIHRKLRSSRREARTLLVYYSHFRTTADKVEKTKLFTLQLLICDANLYPHYFRKSMRAHACGTFVSHRSTPKTYEQFQPICYPTIPTVSCELSASTKETMGLREVLGYR